MSKENNMRKFALFIGLGTAWCLWAATKAQAEPAVPDALTDIRYLGQVLRAPDGNTQRSDTVIAAFKRIWACPSNGSHAGACPGWAIDHIVPLDCGGIDAVWNMQWLPNQIKSAKGPYSKDHFERRIYGGNQLSKGCP